MSLPRYRPEVVCPWLFGEPSLCHAHFRCSLYSGGKGHVFSHNRTLEHPRSAMAICSVRSTIAKGDSRALSSKSSAGWADLFWNVSMLTRSGEVTPPRTWPTPHPIRPANPRHHQSKRDALLALLHFSSHPFSLQQLLPRALYPYLNILSRT